MTDTGIQYHVYLTNTAQQHRHAGVVREDLAAAQLLQQLPARLDNWRSTAYLGLIVLNNATDRRPSSLQQPQMHRSRASCTRTSPQCAPRSEGQDRSSPSSSQTPEKAPRQQVPAYYSSERPANHLPKIPILGSL